MGGQTPSRLQVFTCPQSEPYKPTLATVHNLSRQRGPSSDLDTVVEGVAVPCHSYRCIAGLSLRPPAPANSTLPLLCGSKRDFASQIELDAVSARSGYRRQAALKMSFGVGQSGNASSVGGGVVEGWEGGDLWMTARLFGVAVGDAISLSSILLSMSGLLWEQMDASMIPITAFQTKETFRSHTLIRWIRCSTN